MVHSHQTADPGAQPPDNLSSKLVTRIWHIMDLMGFTPMDIHIRTQIPMDVLFHLHNGTAELTADQLIRICQAMEVHEMAIFDGISHRANLIPEQLLDRGTAQLAARLHAMPSVGRAMVLADVDRRLANG